MQKKEVLLFDLDDVLVDLVPLLSEWHNYCYGTDICREQFYSYNFWEVWGIPKEEALQRIMEFSLSGALSCLEMMPGAQDAVNRLYERYELHIGTARMERFRDVSWRLVSEYFPGKFSGIHFANHHHVHLHRCKSVICDELNAVAMIDDSYANAFSCVHKSRRIFLFDAPWNQEKEIVEGMSRVYSWDQVLEALL